MTTELQVEHRVLPDGRGVAAFTGEVDVSNVGDFAEGLAAAVTPEGVVVDLDGLTYLDSAGVEVLFDMARRSRLAVVAGTGSPVHHLLEVVALSAAATVLDHFPG